ncbi:hypothetical protein ACLOJK_040483 [Asimina triloba]
MQIRWSKLSKSETPKSDLNSTSRPNQHGQQGGPAITTRPIRAACPGPAPQAQIRRLMSMASTSRTQPQQWAIPDPDREHRDPTRRLLTLWPPHDQPQNSMPASPSRPSSTSSTGRSAYPTDEAHVQHAYEPASSSDDSVRQPQAASSNPDPTSRQQHQSVLITSRTPPRPR